MTNLSYISANLIIPFLSTILGMAQIESKERAQSWGKHVLNHDATWYSSEDARTIANNVIQYQSSQGGWPKNTNLTKPVLTPDDIPPEGGGHANSLDNNATSLPMEYLARVIHATGEIDHIESFNKGIDYLLAAQYSNGGWPQFWPLRGDKYYSRITFNDDAMIQVMNLLTGIASGKNPYSFVDKERRDLVANAVKLGLDCILRCQVKQNDQLTVWCAQHDENTLEPAWARAYEPPSLSGSESVGILLYLMSIRSPSPAIIDAVESGVAWFKKVAIKGIRLDKVKNPDGRTERILTPDENAPLLWARFYELETNRPLYLDRDSKFRYDYSEISYERRSGYSYHGNWANSMLEEAYPIWRSKYGAK